MKKLLLAVLLFTSLSVSAGDRKYKPEFIKLTYKATTLVTKVSNINSFDMDKSYNTQVLFHDSNIMVNESSKQILALINSWKYKCEKDECGSDDIASFIPLTVTGGNDVHSFNVNDIEYYFSENGYTEGDTTLSFTGGNYSLVNVRESPQQITLLIYGYNPICKVAIFC